MVVPDASLEDEIEDDLSITRKMVYTNLKLLVIMGGSGLFVGAFVGMFFFPFTPIFAALGGIIGLTIGGIIEYKRWKSGSSYGDLVDVEPREK